MTKQQKPALSEQQRETFTQTALPFMQDLYAYALALSKDRDLARDLVQETYLKAMQHYSRYRDQNMRAWLFKILKNTFLNWAKRKSAHPTESFSEEIHYEEPAKKYPIPAQQWQEAHFRELFSDELFVSLMQLPPEYREVLLLREIEDFSYEEISELLNIPVGTVRSRLHRARQALFKLLMKYPKFARQFAEKTHSPNSFNSAQ